MKRLSTLLILFFSSLLIIECTNDDETEKLFSDFNILFLSRRIENSADWKMYIMDKDGSNQKEISDITVQCTQPVVSNNNKKIAFLHLTELYDYEIYIINLDGTGKQLIDKSHRSCGNLNWSKDDLQLIYTKSTSDTSYGIFINDLNGQIKQLTDGHNCLYADFSPDLKTITICQDCNIFQANFDGTNKKLLIENACVFKWSPKGNRIVFGSTGELNSSQIFVAFADGSKKKQLTFSYKPNWDSGFPTFGNYDAHWSSDERKIVYVSEADDGLPEIYVINADGTGNKRLTDTERRNENPVLSPDGKYIFFSSNRDLNYNFEIYNMDIDGKNQSQLTKYKGDDCFPVIIKKDK